MSYKAVERESFESASEQTEPTESLMKDFPRLLPDYEARFLVLKESGDKEILCDLLWILVGRMTLFGIDHQAKILKTLGRVQY